MHSLLEALTVYTLVVLCAAYCLWIFLPAGLKQRAVRALMARSGRLQASRTLQTVPGQTPRVNNIRWARKPGPPPG